jgi:adenylate cyclase
MAFWNAPLPVEAHARQACLAALRMREGLLELNEAMAAEAAERSLAVAPIRIGIGLNSGVCFVGNMGSEQRFNYSVIGDPVNVASRIEGRCKGYGLEIVIGETTQQAAQDLATLEIDRVQLLGKTTATRLFTLVGDDKVAASERFEELVGEHRAMLAAYRSRDWDGAVAKLRRCHHLGQGYGLDLFYELYGQRIDAFRSDPPPPDWDGSIVAEDKH